MDLVIKGDLDDERSVTVESKAAKQLEMLLLNSNTARTLEYQGSPPEGTAPLVAPHEIQ